MIPRMDAHGKQEWNRMDSSRPYGFFMHGIVWKPHG